MTTVLITGTSSGFGLLTALAFAERGGYRVVATMRDPDGRNRAAAAQLADHEAIAVVEMDVTSDASVAYAVERAGDVDIAVNNAGQVFIGPMEAFTPQQLQHQIDVNLIGVQRVNRAVLPGMRRRRKGLLVHVSSQFGRVVFPFYGPYHASKFALEALAEAYRYELAPFGVDSVLVEPSAYPTEMGNKICFPDDAATTERYGTIASRVQTVMADIEARLTGPDAPSPKEVADAIVKLAEMERGQRPLRTIVGADLGMAKINEAVGPLQQEALERYGLGDLSQPSG